MKCIVHVWRAMDSDETLFRLRLTPLYSLAHGTAVEEFANERALCRRLTEIGLAKACREMTLSNLREGPNAIWSNCEVAEEVFHEFVPFREQHAFSTP
jgi:hypothetical protein